MSKLFELTDGKPLDSATESEILSLVSAGLTPAEALDVYFVEWGKFDQTEWAEFRGITRQAVNENVRKAKEKLEYANRPPTSQNRPNIEKDDLS